VIILKTRVPSALSFQVGPVGFTGGGSGLPNPGWPGPRGGAVLPRAEFADFADFPRFPVEPRDAPVSPDAESFAAATAMSSGSPHEIKRTVIKRAAGGPPAQITVCHGRSRPGHACTTAKPQNGNDPTGQAGRQRQQP
jgi:hypothetical protein